MIVAGCLVGILVLGVLALLLFVDPNKYRGDIQQAVQQHLGRQLTIQGKIELKILPFLAVALHDVQLGNPPGFGTQPFATVRSASVGVKLLPLLGKRIEVRRIAIDGLSATLISRGETNNWQDLTESKQPAPPPQQAAPASSPNASIGEVKISDASLVMRDEVKKSTVRVVLQKLDIGKLASDAAGSSVQNVDGKGTYLSQTDAQGKNGAEQPLPFSVHTAGLTLDARQQALAPATIEMKFGDLALIITASGQKLSTDRNIEGTLSIPKVSLRKMMQALGIVPPVTRDPHALEAFALKSNYHLTRRTLQLSGLNLALDDTHLQGNAAVEDLESDALGFDLRVDSINLDRYRAPEAEKPAAAKDASKSTAPPTPLPLETIRKLNMQGTLRIGTAIVQKLQFTNIVLPLAAKDGRLRLGPTSAGLYGGQYNGDIVLDAHAAQAQLSLNEHLHGTDVGALAKAAYDSTRLSGHTDADVVASGTGNTDQALIHSLNGKIDAVVKQGALNGIDIQYELQRAGMLLNRQVPPAHAGPERTVFSSLVAHCTLSNGMLKTDDLRIETDFLKVHGKGTLDIGSEAVNYQLAASTLSGAHAAGSGLDALKGMEVPLTVTGTLSNPSVRPDVEALAKGQLGNMAKQKAGELLQKKLGGLLGH
jgi:AsmA protein